MLIDKFSEIATSMGVMMAGFIGRVEQASKDAISQVAQRFVPFLVLICVLTAFVNISGFGEWLATYFTPLAGSLWGQVIMAFVFTIPVLSPLLAPASAVAKVFAGLIGTQIGEGLISPNLVLSALWAIEAQVSCDSIAVQLGLMSAEEETIVNGVPSYLLARWVTGPLGVIVGYLCSIGMYQ